MKYFLSTPVRLSEITGRFGGDWRRVTLDRAGRSYVTLAILVMAGCAQGLESDVSGVVSLDGTPLGPGGVVFAPAGDVHNPAVGSIQAYGSYVLNTGRTRGLLPGKYRVSLYIHEMPPGARPGDRQAATPSRIPTRYETVETSGLEFDVRPGHNSIDLKLTSE